MDRLQFKYLYNVAYSPQVSTLRYTILLIIFLIVESYRALFQCFKETLHQGSCSSDGKGARPRYHLANRSRNRLIETRLNYKVRKACLKAYGRRNVSLIKHKFMIKTHLLLHCFRRLRRQNPSLAFPMSAADDFAYGSSIKPIGSLSSPPLPGASCSR